MQLWHKAMKRWRWKLFAVNIIALSAVHVQSSDLRADDCNVSVFARADNYG